MDVISIKNEAQSIRAAFSVISALNLTSILYPMDAYVRDGSCYDFIIVGVGTAGSILANRLTANGKYKVLGIEAGGDPPLETMYPGLFSYLPNSKSDWNITSFNDGRTAKQHKRNVLELTSGKTLGGDSSIGHTIYARGSPEDYKRWARAVNDETWTYEHLLPYFKKTERLEDTAVLNSKYREFHGTSGNMGVTRQPQNITQKYADAFKEMNHKVVLDTNGNDTIGFAEPMFVISESVRQSMGYAFLTTIKNRKNLKILKNTLVTKILLDMNNNAIGVKAMLHCGQIITLKAKREVIVCAGTLKSPQLLMLSGIGPAKHLKRLKIKTRVDLPVGKNYQDHLRVIFAHKLNIKDNKSPPANPGNFPLPIIIGYVALNRSQNYADYQAMNFIIRSDSKSLLSQCSVSYSFKDNICQSMYNITKGYETMFTKHGVLHPKSRGEILLKSKDPNDDPLIKTNFYTNKQDLEDEVDYLLDFLQVINTTVFKEHEAEFVHLDLPECDVLGRGSRQYWKCYAFNMMSTTYHYSSTCSMGLVVDGRLKVFGVNKLRIVDASVMPYSTGGNIQAPVMVIAEKGADMMIEDNYETVDESCKNIDTKTSQSIEK